MQSSRTRIGRFIGIEWFKNAETRSDTVVFLGFWIIGFPIFFSTSYENLPFFERLIGNLYLVFIYTSASWLITNILFPTFLPTKRTLALTFWTVPVVAMIHPISISVNALLYNTDISLKLYYWLFSTANNFQNVLMIVSLLIAKKFFRQQQHTLKLESDRRQAELQRLRSQVDPHFLFNSLNILDILIEDDKEEARKFVHKLSNLYRYLIRNRDEDLVPADKEIAYARDYHYLVEQRFGNAFQLREDIAADDLSKLYMPPGALQTVLENVYKHNLATERNPVVISIERKNKALFVSNDFSPKPGKLATHEQSGSGTQNLIRRYSLLSDSKAYSRKEGEYWTARLPLLEMEINLQNSATENLQISNTITQ